MFFDKAWKDVTDEEITSLASELKEKIGGHIFHTKIDFTKVTPFVSLDAEIPEAVRDWTANN